MGEKIINNRNINETIKSIQCNYCGSTWFIQEQAARFQDLTTFTPNQRKTPQTHSEVTILRCVQCGTTIVPPSSTTGIRAVDNYMTYFYDEIEKYTNFHEHSTYEQTLELKYDLQESFKNSMIQFIENKIEELFLQYVKDQEVLIAQNTVNTDTTPKKKRKSKAKNTDNVEVNK